MAGYGLPSGFATSRRSYNPFGNGISMNTLYQARRQAELDDLAWAEEQRDWERQDRRNAQQMAEQANVFINDWMGDLDRAGEIYDQALGSVDQIDSLADQLAHEWEAYGQQFGGLQDDLITAAGSDLENRGRMSAQFIDAATPDYGGATRRAVADVAQQSQQGRDAMTRTMTGMGINPNSGKALAGLRQSYLDEAKNKALAINTARNNETTRSGNMAATGMQLFDPSNTAGLAIQIKNGQNDLLTTQAGLRSQSADSRQAIAGNYANTIGQQRGEAAGTLMGLTTSAGGNPFIKR